MALISDELLDAIIAESDHSLVKAELTDGVTSWETPFTPSHQRLVAAIHAGVRCTLGKVCDCGCHTIQNAVVRFPEGSFRSPDLAIYDRALPEDDHAITVVPVAVVEVLSPGFEAKDRLALPFYLAQGIADVVLVDPRANEIVHATSQVQTLHQAPVDLTFACGCAVTIPL